MYSNLVGKQIAEVRKIASNVMVLIMGDGSTFALGAECVVATQYGDIYGPTIRELNKEEIEEYLTHQQEKGKK
jgi:hypothetical protein